jgi:hypothetical protein
LTLGVGQYFTRNETWAEQAKPWVDYLSRASFMLQQGRAANDIAVFYGEAVPAAITFRDDYPAVPEGYRYDYVNADTIINKMSVRDGAIATATGMRYQALFVARGAELISLPVLRKLREMVSGGAVLIGPKPQGSPSLADDQNEAKSIIDLLWRGGPVTVVGQGRVFVSSDTAGPLQDIKLSPDFVYSKPNEDSKVMFIHRRLSNSDLYFLSNRMNRAEAIEASFRVIGRKAELWDPATGQIAPASYRIENGRTRVTIPLDPLGSIFVVFRESTGSQQTRILPATAQQAVLELSGPWQVAFQADRGAPAAATFEKLADFRDNPDPGIRYFSGIATYSKEVQLPAQPQDARLYLDLGQVCDIAEVWVNGKMMGTAWKPPYRVEITGATMTGANRIEIKSVNLWVNRLIGDVQPGVMRKYTFTFVDGKPLPAGVRGGRGATMPYRPDSPLRASGLIGPVKILREMNAGR